GAVVIQTTDPQAALDTFEKGAVAAGNKPHESTYRGTKIEVAGSDTYAAIGNLVVSGRQPGVEAAIAASQGSSLADSKAYTSSIDAAPADRVFTAWVDPGRIIDAAVARGSLPAQQAKVLRTVTGNALSQPIAA